MIATAFPPSYGMSINDQAITEAQTGQKVALLIEGYIDGECGLPTVLKPYADKMTLRIYSTYDAPVALGVYFLEDRKAMEGILGQLEDHGGYRYVLYDPDGRIIAHN